MAKPESRKLATCAWLLLHCSLVLPGCTGEREPREGSVASERPRSGEQLRDEMRQKKRKRALELIQTRPAYPRPPRDPKVSQAYIGEKIAFVDAEFGDTLIMLSVDPHRNMIDYELRTKDGEFVGFFKVQIIGPLPDETGPAIYRVYAITKNQNMTGELEQALSRMPLPRFAQFISSRREYIEHPERVFVVVDAPLGANERLF